MKKIVFLISLIFVFLSCQEQTNQTKGTEKKVEVKSDAADLTKENTKSPIITENSFGGIKIGGSINLESKNIKKETQQNGEGSFSGYALLDDNGNKIGFIFPKHDDENIIHIIEINSPNYKTKEGIGIGSTYQDLKNSYSNIETHGSEIEGRTSSRVGGLSFLLDAYFSTYEIDESKIKPSTKVKKISILGIKN